MKLRRLRCLRSRYAIICRLGMVLSPMAAINLCSRSSALLMGKLVRLRGCSLCSFVCSSYASAGSSMASR